MYSGSQLLAKIEGGASTYYHADHLSARVMTDSSGNVAGQRGHYPYGETWYETGTTTKWKFTSYERDYDRYGNRTAQSILGGCVPPQTCPTNSVTVNGTTNRITGSPYAYDLNGNMTNDGLNTLTYDGENRAVTSASGGTTSTYTYDGNSLRVKKQVGNATATVYIFSGTKVIAEYAAGANPNAPTREYIYSGSALLATIEGSTTKYHHADHLSVRVTTDSSGNALGQQGHYPFGEQWYPAPPRAPATKWQFTSYERDGGTNESGNDYAMMRYHVNRLGLFSSPDPLAGSVADPQSLNRYPYTHNDPINLVDPLGLLECDVDWSPSGGWSIVCHDSVTVHGGAWGAGTGGLGGQNFDLPLILAPGYGGRGNPRGDQKAGPKAPVSPCVVTQGFNSQHRANDIRTPGGYGTNLPAPEAGTVVAGRSTGWRVPPPYDFRGTAPAGATNFVRVQTTSGYTVTYWHADPVVPLGSQVLQGQTIGSTDDTGRQTGPHVHVTVTNPAGNAIDPRQYFPQCR